jgi:hypothetical protein
MRTISLAGAIVALIGLVGCAPQYREDYEADARNKASNQCRAEGIGPDNRGYYACFQPHLAALMTAAPAQSRPVQLTDDDVCRGYGFTDGTDGFASCIQRRDEQRQQNIRAILSSPIIQPAAPRTCYSTTVGISTTTNCY